MIETSNPFAPHADKAKKGKLVAKSMGHKYQFQIMELIGVLRSEVGKFADPYHWLSYFPPITTVSPDLLSTLSILTICLPRQTIVPWAHA